MSVSKRRTAMVALALAVACGTAIYQAKASDHADTLEIAQRPGADITDVFMFPSADNPNNVVLMMTVNPLIPAGQSGSVSFDPGVLYQFKIDNSGDAVEDLVIQATFEGTGANQRVKVAGPVRPNVTGTISTLQQPYATLGTINQTFSPTNGVKVFAGAREDPFFFDLERFFQILPDRAYPITGQPDPTPNVPKAASWRSAGQAVDFLTDYNVLAIVIELPRPMLAGR
jgi:hypothetical protein